MIDFEFVKNLSVIITAALGLAGIAAIFIRQGKFIQRVNGHKERLDKHEKRFDAQDLCISGIKKRHSDFVTSAAYELRRKECRDQMFSILDEWKGEIKEVRAAQDKTNDKLESALILLARLGKEPGKP